MAAGVSVSRWCWLARFIPWVTMSRNGAMEMISSKSKFLTLQKRLNLKKMESVSTEAAAAHVVGSIC